MRALGRHHRALLVWAAFCLLPLVASAQEAPKITDIQLGLKGRYCVGDWTPVQVTIIGGSEQVIGAVELSAPDGDGTRAQFSMPRPIRIGAREQVTALLYAKVGQDPDSITATLRSEGVELAHAEVGAGGSQRPGHELELWQELLVCVGPPAVGSDSAAPGQPAPKMVVVRFDDVGQLPTRWYGYDAVDAVVLATSKPEIYRQFSLTSARFEALDHWVRMGGRLVLCVGREAPEVLAAGTPLAAWAPGRFTGFATLREPLALESYAQTTDRILSGDAARGFRLKVPKLADVRGVIEAYEGNSPADLPLIVRAPRGMGEVVFVALDLDQPPLAGWSGRTQFLNKLLARAARASEPDPAIVGNMGYNDLAGNLHSALDQFSGVQPVEFSFVALLIIIYIALIGPGDYWLVKHVLKRMELTWITFPVIVVLFSGLGYGLSYWFKGNDLRMNQVDVVDFDLDSQMVRGTTWANLFSPRVDRFNLTLEPLWGRAGSSEPEVLLAWMGVPGSGFGGMSSPAGGSLLDSQYRFAPALNALEVLPINVWSTKGIVGRWSGQALPPIEANLTGQADDLVTGTISSNLDFDLEDCVLLCGRWAYPLKNLRAGSRLDVSRQLDPQSATTYFQQAAGAHHGPESLNVDDVVMAMMFRELGAGSSFPQLSNRYQQFVDLSQQVRTGRAVLVGQARGAGARVLRDGRPLDDAKVTGHTFLRFVIPVKPARGESR